MFFQTCNVVQIFFILITLKYYKMDQSSFVNNHNSSQIIEQMRQSKAFEIKAPSQIEIKQRKLFDKNLIKKNIVQKQDEDYQFGKALSSTILHRNKLTQRQKQIIDLVSPVKQVYFDSIVSTQALSLTKLRQMSGYPEIVDSFFYLFSSLAQSQTDIDPISMEPVKMPTSKQYVITFLQQCCKLNDPVKIIQSILEQYKSQTIVYQQLVQNAIRPIIQKADMCLKFFNYTIDKNVFLQVFMNKRSLTFTQQEKIQEIQSNVAKERLKQMTSYGYPQGDHQAISQAKGILARKRQQFQLQTKDNFQQNFQIVTDIPDLHKSILTALSKKP